MEWARLGSDDIGVLSKQPYCETCPTSMTATS